MTTGWQPGGEPPIDAPATVPPPLVPLSGYTPPPPPPGYGYNWGLAYPAPGYQAVYLVPRPPRPGVVNLAVLLTILGVLVSGAQFAINVVVTYANKNDLVTQLGGANGAQSRQVVDTVFQVGVGFAVAIWLLPAAGALVTALLARRGSNAARIVLASLMGLFALNGLCGGVFGLVNPRMTAFTAGRDSGLSPVFDLVLAGLAVAVGVLVLVPSANRFFSAGPGHRFMAST
jgi:hypothetical protein